MKRTMIGVAALFLWMIAALPTPAQPPATRPAPGKDALPPPQEIPLPRTVVSIRIVPGPELGKRNVWELYSVNSRGQFVPRVVMAPGGYYYLSDGRPYPWPILGSGAYMPHAVD